MTEKMNTYTVHATLRIMKQDSWNELPFHCSEITTSNTDSSATDTFVSLGDRYVCFRGKHAEDISLLDFATNNAFSYHIEAKRVQQWLFDHIEKLYEENGSGTEFDLSIELDEKRYPYFRGLYNKVLGIYDLATFILTQNISFEFKQAHAEQAKLAFVQSLNQSFNK